MDYSHSAFVPPDTIGASQSTFGLTDAFADSQSTFGPTGAFTNSQSTYGPTDAVANSQSTYGRTDAITGSQSTFVPTDAVTDSQSTFVPTDAVTDSQSTFGSTDAVTDSQSTFVPTDAVSDSQSTFGPTDTVADSQSTGVPTDDIVDSPMPKKMRTSSPTSGKSTSSPLRTTLTLSQRMEVIKKGLSGKSTRELAAEFGVGRTQISNTMKRKDEIMEQFEGATCLSKKRNSRTTGNEPINELVLRWYLERIRKRVNINGPMLKEKALQFAEELSIWTFSASNGWLDSFTRRNSIEFNKLGGESSDVNTDICDWMGERPSIINSYDSNDIYSMVEFGLFFKLSSDKSFYKDKGIKCGGGKKSKERITIALCANSIGDQEPALVIGQSARPKAFGPLDTSSLPITYTHSRKAWMTTELFISWLSKFNAKMEAQNRHVLLFLDKAPCHIMLKHDNVKLVFFPTDSTSILQPLNEEVIQSMKLGYRKLQFRFLMAEMEADQVSSGSDVMKQVNMRHAVYWVAKAWKEVEASTIQRCFINAGFDEPAYDERIFTSLENSEPIPSGYNELSQSIVGMPFTQIVEVDNELATCDSEFLDWDKPATEILKEIRDTNQAKDGACNDGEEDSHVYSQEAFEALSTLRTFFQQNCLLKSLDSIDDMETDLLKFVHLY